MGGELRKGLDAEAGLRRATSLIREAIQILDEVDAPAHLAAHLDFALHCINEVSLPK